MICGIRNSFSIFDKTVEREKYRDTIPLGLHPLKIEDTSPWV
jgi:hypothetical protein